MTALPAVAAIGITFVVVGGVVFILPAGNVVVLIVLTSRSVLLIVIIVFTSRSVVLFMVLTGGPVAFAMFVVISWFVCPFTSGGMLALEVLISEWRAVPSLYFLA